MRRVLFLFNHDSAHQVAHLATVAEAMAREAADATTVIAYANAAIRERLEELIDPLVTPRIEWRALRLPRLLRSLSAIVDRLLPASRLLRLFVNRALFEAVDVVVSPERTCLQVKRVLHRDRTPLFAMLPHGAGDRSVSYHPDFAQFDRVLVAGPKVVDQLVAHGVDRARIAIVGYPKFDSLDLAARPNFFANDRPTFVYNPHFDPHLSSWYDAGPDLLRWFASPDGQAFNLVFAPHVMLFRKLLHVSPEYRTSRLRPDIPDEARTASNILIDCESSKLFDMSYMLGTDAYIGDVSSQIYEFLVRPRPAFFLDCRSEKDTADEEWLVFRRAGPTAASVKELTPMLPGFRAIGEKYLAVQRDLFEYTFSIEDRSASERAASEIIRWLSELPG